MDFVQNWIEPPETKIALTLVKIKAVFVSRHIIFIFIKNMFEVFIKLIFLLCYCKSIYIIMKNNFFSKFY